MDTLDQVCRCAWMGIVYVEVVSAVENTYLTVGVGITTVWHRYGVD